MKGLEDKANLASPVGCQVRKLRYRFSPIAQGPCGWLIEPAQHLKQGGLSAPAGSGDGNEFARGNSKINTAQRLHLAVVEIFLQPDRLEYGRLGSAAVWR